MCLWFDREKRVARDDDKDWIGSVCGSYGSDSGGISNAITNLRIS